MLMDAKIDRFLDEAWIATPFGGKRLTTLQATEQLDAMKNQRDAILVYGVDNVVPRRSCAAVCIRGEAAVWLHVFFRQGEDDWYKFKFQLTIKPHRPTQQQRARGDLPKDRQRPDWFRSGRRRPRPNRDV